MSRSLYLLIAFLCPAVFALAISSPASAQETGASEAPVEANAAQEQQQPAVPPLPPMPEQQNSPAPLTPQEETQEPAGGDSTEASEPESLEQDERTETLVEPAGDDVEVTDSPETWFSIDPAAAGAVFKMPSAPREVQREFTLPGGQIRQVNMFLSSFHDEETSIVLSYHDLNEEPQNNNRITTVLDGAVRGAVANVLGSVESHNPIRIGRHHARDFVYSAEIQEQPIKIASRVILVGSRVYSMAVVMKTENYDTGFCSGFFESFQLKAGGAGNN
ncbi:MAG: hypothetical protein AAF456_04585 [Planctomycetota bacterium]